MKNLLLILVVAATTLAGCKKETDCEKFVAGTLTINNGYNGQIDVYIDDNFKQTLQANESKNIFPVTIGTHKINVVEKDNACSDFQTNADIYQCEAATINYTADAQCCQINNTGTFSFSNNTIKLIIWKLQDYNSFSNLYAGDNVEVTLPVGSYHFVAYSPQGGQWEYFFQISQCQTEGISIIP